MRILAAFSILVIAVAGCQVTEPASQDRTSTAGIYILRTVNDTVPPYVVLRGPSYAIEILNDTLNLSADGLYKGIAHYRRTNADFTTALVADTVTGTWILLGSTVSLKAANGDLSSANSSVNNTRLTVQGGGLVSVYTR